MELSHLRATSAGLGNALRGATNDCFPAPYSELAFLMGKRELRHPRRRKLSGTGRRLLVIADHLFDAMERDGGVSSNVTSFSASRSAVRSLVEGEKAGGRLVWNAGKVLNLLCMPHQVRLQEVAENEERATRPIQLHLVARRYAPSSRKTARTGILGAGVRRFAILSSTRASHGLYCPPTVPNSYMKALKPRMHTSSSFCGRCWRPR